MDEVLESFVSDTTATECLPSFFKKCVMCMPVLTSIFTYSSTGNIYDWASLSWHKVLSTSCRFNLRGNSDSFSLVLEVVTVLSAVQLFARL